MEREARGGAGRRGIGAVQGFGAEDFGLRFRAKLAIVCPSHVIAPMFARAVALAQLCLLSSTPPSSEACDSYRL